MIYEVYGYCYLSDGVRGDQFIAEFTSKEEAVKVAFGIVDGMQYVDSSVYALACPNSESCSLVFQYT